MAPLGCASTPFAAVRQGPKVVPSTHRPESRRRMLTPSAGAWMTVFVTIWL
jgi:hypothetical protein